MATTTAAEPKLYTATELQTAIDTALEQGYAEGHAAGVDEGTRRGADEADRTVRLALAARLRDLGNQLTGDVL